MSLVVGMTRDDMIKLDLKVQMSLADGKFDRLGVKPKSSCKQCYGRGTPGKDVAEGPGKGRFIICGCLLKHRKEMEDLHLKKKAEREQAEGDKKKVAMQPDIVDAEVVESKPVKPSRRIKLEEK